MRSSCTIRRDINHMANTIIRALDREVVLAELQQSTVILQRFRLKITADYAQPARPKAHVKTRDSRRAHKRLWMGSFARKIVKT